MEELRATSSTCDAYGTTDAVFWQGLSGSVGTVLCLEDLKNWSRSALGRVLRDRELGRTTEKWPHDRQVPGTGSPRVVPGSVDDHAAWRARPAPIDPAKDADQSP
ncbi:hypothetical protein [Umezawaea sp. Da 62-37]|uniref:hypothetical protein n=1 Tax=Umezawaea sp. Da 62-37 TaxID=3075927 RepID=UPI0028F722FB|nr:hypothetical protein [Umezawaea sp. Da 62-37]WNV85388.1 hypothetical protein RM788_45935 [Umezawaea sp. Da 62-37]